MDKQKSIIFLLPSAYYSHSIKKEFSDVLGCNVTYIKEGNLNLKETISIFLVGNNVSSVHNGVLTRNEMLEILDSMKIKET